MPEADTPEVNDVLVTILSGRCLRWKRLLSVRLFRPVSESEVMHAGSGTYASAAGVLGDAEEGCVSGVLGEAGLSRALSLTGVVCNGCKLGFGRTMRLDWVGLPLLDMRVGERALRGGGGKLPFPSNVERAAGALVTMCKGPLIEPCRARAPVA